MRIGTQDKIGVVLLAAAGLLFAAGFIVWYKVHPAPPIDTQTGCRKDGNYSAVAAVLIDTTDTLIPVQAQDLRTELATFAENIPQYGKLELYLMQPASEGLIKPILAVCNPGRGTDVSQWTGNPGLMDRRWHNIFEKRVDQTFDHMLAQSTPSRESPIMEEIQQVAVQTFIGHQVQAVPKQLVVVSDMLQNSTILDNYREEPSFEQFRVRPEFIRVRPELEGVNVIIFYVNRSAAQRRQGARQIEFWQSYFAESGATVVRVKRING